MRGEEENEEGGKEKEGEEEDTCQSSQPGGLHVVKLNSSTTHPPRATHAQCKGLLRNSHVHEYQGGSSQTYQVSGVRCQKYIIQTFELHCYWVFPIKLRAT